MLKERYAFEFHESIFNKQEIQQLAHVTDRDTKLATIDLDQTFKVIERANTLSTCVRNLCTCYVEGQKTKELEKRIQYAKEILDTKVEEEAIRAEIEIQEFMKRSEAQLQYMEKELALHKKEIAKIAELERTKFEDNYKLERQKKDMLIKQRRKQKELLDNCSKCLEHLYNTQQNKEDKELLKANELYRSCLRDYTEMISIGRR